MGRAGRAVLRTANRNNVAPKPVSTAQAVVIKGMMPCVAALDTNTLHEKGEDKVRNTGRDRSEMQLGLA